MLGLAVMAGASALADRWAAIGESDVTNWVQLGIGVAMLLGHVVVMCLPALILLG